jgi:hypothetical protein
MSAERITEAEAWCRRANDLHLALDVANDHIDALRASMAARASALEEAITWMETYRRTAYDQPHPNGPLSTSIDKARAALAQGGAK